MPFRYRSLVACVALTFAGSNAFASQDDALPAPFNIDEAARCAATFAFTLDAMNGAKNIPQNIKRGMRDSLAIWEYELARSSPGATQATLQAAANRAVGYVRADMPAGETREAAQARGDFLQNAATTCTEKIAVAYDQQVHPVIPMLRESEVAVEPEAAPKRGLR